MKNESVLVLENLPFCIGVSSNPLNPKNLPSTYSFELIINHDIGRLEQSDNEPLKDFLDSAYSLGIEMGTPSDNTDLGLPYVDDFITFIDKHVDKKGKVLEIGAGTGFLSRVLIDKGWDVDSIEPGTGYSNYWEKYGIKVVNDFFPSTLLSGPYDLIIFYTVLEHLKDTTTFLKQVASFLTEDGKVVLSVPDCTMEIEIGDPSILLHEHYQYFTAPSLKRTLHYAGLSANVEASTFARSLYAIAVKTVERTNSIEPLVIVEEDFLNYGNKVTSFRRKFQNKIDYYCQRGSVGLYCPARALNLISEKNAIRFFDDNPLFHGKYYPPFKFKIESREQLVNNPTDYLLIASRTFGMRLRSELQTILPNTIIDIVNILDVEE